MLPDELQPLKSLLAQHCIYRANSLNLIASENIPSPLVEGLISEDLQRRYGNYIGIDLQDRHYQGNRYIAEIEEYAHRLGREPVGQEPRDGDGEDDEDRTHSGCSPGEWDSGRIRPVSRRTEPIGFRQVRQ